MKATTWLHLHLPENSESKGIHMYVNMEKVPKGYSNYIYIYITGMLHCSKTSIRHVFLKKKKKQSEEVRFNKYYIVFYEY